MNIVKNMKSIVALSVLMCGFASQTSAGEVEFRIADLCMTAVLSGGASYLWKKYAKPTSSAIVHAEPSASINLKNTLKSFSYHAGVVAIPLIGAIMSTVLQPGRSHGGYLNFEPLISLIVCSCVTLPASYIGNQLAPGQ